MNVYADKDGRKVVVNRKEEKIQIFDKPTEQGGKPVEFTRVDVKKVIVPATKLPTLPTGPLPPSTPVGAISGNPVK